MGMSEGGSRRAYQLGMRAPLHALPQRAVSLIKVWKSQGKRSLPVFGPASGGGDGNCSGYLSSDPDEKQSRMDFAVARFGVGSPGKRWTTIMANEKLHMDRITIAFPDVSSADAVMMAHELERELLDAGVPADAIASARTDAQAMDLGGVLVLLGGIGFELLKEAGRGAANEAGHQAFRALSAQVRQAVSRVCQRRRVGAEVTLPGGRSIAFGHEFLGHQPENRGAGRYRHAGCGHLRRQPVSTSRRLRQSGLRALRRRGESVVRPADAGVSGAPQSSTCSMTPKPPPTSSRPSTATCPPIRTCAMC